MSYDWVTDEMFDQKLSEIVNARDFDPLSVPGAYEVFSEFFNNRVLSELEAERGAE